MLATSRSYSLLIAAVAVLGAGTADVEPLRATSVEVQRLMAQLVNDSAPAFSDPSTVDWSETLSAAKDNFNELQARFEAHPFADLSAWSGLQSHYADMVGDEIEQSLAGIKGIWSGDGYALGLEHVLPQVTEMLHNGDAFGAYSLVNAEFLYDLLNITEPFFTRVQFWGSGELIVGASSIPGDLLHRMGDVADVFSDYMLWARLANAVLAPGIGAMFQAVQTGGGINELFQAGDTAVALTALSNLPATVASAFLNGYAPPAGGEEGTFTGLLSAGGIFDQLFVTIPQQIADALNATAPLGSAADAVGDAMATVDPTSGADALWALLS
ncbi:hypothetical protein NM962_03875 [Mycobacterium sp. SVM_VP21]|nr:hypothetical protein NM962_03875 [Mycobacterium sp. SVM_VP21]